MKQCTSEAYYAVQIDMNQEVFMCLCHTRAAQEIAHAFRIDVAVRKINKGVSHFKCAAGVNNTEEDES